MYAARIGILKYWLQKNDQLEFGTCLKTKVYGYKLNHLQTLGTELFFPYKKVNLERSMQNYYLELMKNWESYSRLCNQIYRFMCRKGYCMALFLICCDLCVIKWLYEIISHSFILFCFHLRYIDSSGVSGQIPQELENLKSLKIL